MFQNIIKKIQSGRLRNKIILYFIILATAPMLALGAVTLYLLDLSHKQDVSALERQLLAQKNEEIEKFLADTLGVLELKLGVTQTTQVESATLPWQEILAKEILASHSSFEEVSFIDLRGKERARKLRSEGEGVLQDVSLLPKFTHAREGEKYISEVYYTMEGPMLTLAAPVTLEGRIVQVLAADVSLAPLVHSIETSYLGTSGYAALIDKNGALIARGGTGERVFGSSFLKWGRIEQILRGNTFDGLGKGDRYESPLTGVPVVGAGERVRTTGWALLVEWPLADADQLIEEVRTQIILFALFGVIAVLLLAPLFASRLVIPIRLLEKRAQRIEKGEFETWVDMKTGDELEDLNRAFNRMAKGLKRLEELKDEFVFVAAHELKAPVSVIKGYLSMITEGGAGAVSGKTKEFLSQIERANANLITLVQDLLQVARSEAGRIEVRVGPIALEDIIREVVEGFALQAKEKSIELLYDGGHPPKVLADRDKAKEIVTNLVSNAIKYTPHGGKITIKHEVKEGKVITAVSDTGVGLSGEQQKKLFEKFYRAKQKGTEEVSGTGLGLWITRELVRRMGGEIWVESELGKGSVFSFSLPLA